MYRQLGALVALLGLALGVSPLPAADTKDATPSNTAPSKTGRAFLGVAVASTDKDSEEQGAVVRQVTPDSPAAKAGLREGDVITRIDGREIDSPHALINTLAKRHPGDNLSFKVLRDGKEQNVQVTLGQQTAARPTNPDEGDRPGRNQPGRPGRDRASAFLGVEAVSMDEMTPRLRKRLGISGQEGLVVMEVVGDSPADKAGLRHGDVITAVNGKEVENANQLREVINKAGVGKEVRLEVMRGSQKKELTAKLEEAPVDGFSMTPLPGLGENQSGYRGPLGLPLLPERARVQQLERRIQQLEERLRELEQNQNKGKK